MRQFTVRDLLWCTLVIAISLSWWIEHRSADLLRRTNEDLVSLHRSDEIVMATMKNKIAEIASRITFYEAYDVPNNRVKRKNTAAP